MSKEELVKLPKEKWRNVFEGFTQLGINLYDYDSALVINVSKLWHAVMDL